MDYRAGSYHMSKQSLNVVKQLIRNEQPTQEDSGLSKREWEELMATLNQ